MEDFLKREAELLKEQKEAKTSLSTLRKQDQASRQQEKQARADSVRMLAKNKSEFSFRNELGGGGGGGGGCGGGRTAMRSFEPKSTHLQFKFPSEASLSPNQQTTSAPAGRAAPAMLNVAVPANASPGSIITAKSPTGETMSIRVPANAKVSPYDSNERMGALMSS